MVAKKIFFSTILAGLMLSSCTKGNQEKTKTTTKINSMNSYISMFEIPATDISRAINFYQAILEIKIELMEVEGMKMGVFPYENQMVTGIIIQADGCQPSADGITMYLNAGENLQVVLDRVEKNGGQIIVPKTAHADESGYFAIFLDSEGNKMGLNSPNREILRVSKQD